MATFEKHCEASQREFGNPYPEIHRWLDEFHGVEPYMTRHRKLRHHAAGVRLAIEIFGDYAEKVTMQHIIIDLKEEGWTDSDHFPLDEFDYVSMGLW